MRDLLTDLMESAARRADYADARWVRSARERLATRGGRLAEVERREEEGIGVRVRVGGSWGFAASRGSERAGAADALRRALALAEAQGDGAAPAALAPAPPARGTHEAGTGRDPFAVPLEEKLDLLLTADEALRAEPRVRVSRASLLAFRDEKVFASTEGALFEQRTTECGGGIAAIAVDGEETQVRSYPASHDGGVAQAGWEHVLELDLAGHAPRVAEEAAALLSAPACSEGHTTVILDGEQLALQLHESVGHALELDRVLGLEAAYAGTSWIHPADRGRRRYGSALMGVTADATTPGGLGSFRWDDEGVEARPEPLVREGVLCGFLSSRESAGQVGAERSSACMRASSFARQPLVRMTNVHLEPGRAGTLDDLVADTDRGLLLETNRSWSIDSERLHFQFATEVAWEIRGGERGRMLRNPTYAGVTPGFWAGLDAVCSPAEWRLWSLLNCGKGEPGQLMRVSHGTAPARFRDVQVGVA
jgi:TldD protein